jgi:polar amino acid transport system substrate-binding protein
LKAVFIREQSNLRLKGYLRICILLFASWSFPLVSQANEPIIINDADWPPYFFKGESNSPIGLGKEVLSVCLSELGYSFEFVPFPLKRMHKYIQEGKIDTNIFSFKPERVEYLVFGNEAIFKASYRIITRSDEDRQISKITDLENMRLGHLAGLTYSDEFLADTHVASR